MDTVIDYLEARVQALQNQLELQKAINEVKNEIPMDGDRAVWIIRHLNNKYGIPYTQIAKELGVTREWLRLNLRSDKLTLRMRNRVRDMVEDMISDLQLVMVEEVKVNI